MSLEEKLGRLTALLKGHGQVAVAFSGGVDSSFLLHFALSVLGPARVLALHADSCLRTPEERKSIDTWADRYFPGVEVRLALLDFGPLAWKEIAANTAERCYFCKRRIYALFFEEMERQGVEVLLDGTNVDDLKDRRPGLRALHELRVQTPLVEAGLNKEEIRRLSREAGLDTWDQPSSSCLATRIPVGMPLSEELLGRIGLWERFLHGLGFAACRVRLHSTDHEAICIEVRATDLAHLVDDANRLFILRFFRRAGFFRVSVDLEGRI